jgi:hypothetical protein
VVTRSQGLLQLRIEEARRKRKLRDAAAQRPGESFENRRRQTLLRDAITKMQSGHFAALSMEHIEAVTRCHENLSARGDLRDNDKRLKSLIEPYLEDLSKRASELRRRRAKERRS